MANSGFKHDSVPARSPKNESPTLDHPAAGRPAPSLPARPRVVKAPSKGASPGMKPVHVPGGTLDGFAKKSG